MSRNLFWLSDEQWARIVAAIADGCARCRARGRPSCHQRHRACAQKRLPLVRLPASLWSANDDL